MYTRIHDTLHRQDRALNLLFDLLLEEYQLLIARNTQAVVSLEFSIHELIRQIAGEKSAVIHLLNGGRVLHYAELLPEDQGMPLRELYAAIDAGEQSCSRQASLNAELSLALLDQSQRTMQELHNQVMPPSTQVYGRKGAMGSARPMASFISGRL